MATWADLDGELRLWQAAGEVPTFWWRDDDTEAPTAELDRLIALAERFSTPLHLAVVPHAIDPALAPRLDAAPLVHCLQHGFAHKNHEPKGARASEVGLNRDLDLQRTDLAEGWRRMLEAKLPNLLPVFVPPWNRIADKTLRALPGLGYRAVSIFDQRPDDPVGPPHFNGHIDPIRWKEGARFAGEEKALEQCVRHLARRRSGEADKAEPTGFVTHHLQTDEATWDFCMAFLDRLAAQGATRWIVLEEVMKDDQHG
ncbi:hypothetical protein BOO69_15325 [Sulfitobacter alexandrii]|uniref:Polysaccharide deacetylase n=1 Tax=Sulfitobacter alexandrii TaxID=1917485 RepID=A0A1J0WJZ7_9RHOB|nr:polysaccharide deacetylase family protein [Sulfitobacter alexandrii]APE44627.1 hypothetical protein BOO69_15325 [Sulfitobacter alexandrii]